MRAAGETVVVADVGNTRIKLAVVGIGITATRLPEVALRQDLLSHEFRPANLQQWLDRAAAGTTLLLVASVHDRAAVGLEAAIAEVAATGHRTIRQHRIAREHLPIAVEVDEPSRVGIDRVAAAAAALVVVFPIHPLAPAQHPTLRPPLQP